MVAEDRIEKLEDCDCKKSCKLVDGVIRDDGTQWQMGCETCTCSQGNVTCTNVDCPHLQCKHPVLVEGQCCPICKGNSSIVTHF